MNKKKNLTWKHWERHVLVLNCLTWVYFFYHALYWLRRKSVSVIVSGKRTRVCDFPRWARITCGRAQRHVFLLVWTFLSNKKKKLEGSQPHKEATLSVPIRRRNNSRLEPLNKAFRNWLKEMEGRSGVLRGRKSHVWKVKYISSPELRGEKKKL